MDLNTTNLVRAEVLQVQVLSLCVSWIELIQQPMEAHFSRYCATIFDGLAYAI